jgi:three-Cys-motif partner protein
MAKEDILWKMTRPTAAKHVILRKYLDAWLPILGGGRYARDDLILIDAFAGPGRYSGGEEGSPLLMLKSYLEHPAEIKAQPHFFFIEENRARARHLESELAALPLAGIEVEVIPNSFDPAFAELIARLENRFRQLPPTFAFIDPFGAGPLPIALSSPLLDVPRCEVLVYFPLGYIARFGEQQEFKSVMDNVFSGGRWRRAFAAGVDFETRKRMLLDLFMDELRKRVPFVRAFEITPAHEAGGNTYYLVFGTANADQGLRKMKDAMWKVDRKGGQRFVDSTLADHPVLFDDKAPALDETAFRDNGHLKRPTLAPAEKRGELEVRRREGQKAGSFTAGTRIRFSR